MRDERFRGADCSPHGQGVPCRYVGPSTPPPATPYRAVGVLVVRKESGKSWLYVLTVAGPPGEILCRTCGPDFYPADRTYPQLLPRQSCPAPSLGLVCGMREWGAGCNSRRSRALCARSFRTCDADSCPADWIYPRPPPLLCRIAFAVSGGGLPGTLCQPLAQHLVTSRRVLSWNKSVELPEGGLVQPPLDP